MPAQDTASLERTRKRTIPHSLSACVMMRRRCCWIRMPRASCHGQSGERPAIPASPIKTRQSSALLTRGRRQRRRCLTPMRRRSTGRCACTAQRSAVMPGRSTALHAAALCSSLSRGVPLLGRRVRAAAHSMRGVARTPGAALVARTAIVSVRTRGCSTTGLNPAVDPVKVLLSR